MKDNIFRDINNKEINKKKHIKSFSNPETSQGEALMSEMLTYEHLDFTLRYLRFNSEWKFEEYNRRKYSEVSL